MYVTGCGVTDSDTDDASLFQLCNCGVFLSDKEKRAKLLRCSDGDRSLSQCGCYYSVARIVRCKLSACLAHGVKVKFRIRFKNRRHSRRHEWSTNRICSKVKYQATRNVPTNSKRARARTFPLVRNNLQHDLTIKGTWKMEIQSPLAPSHCIADGAELTGLAF